MHDILHLIGFCNDGVFHPNIIGIITGFDNAYFAWNYFKFYYFKPK